MPTVTPAPRGPPASTPRCEYVKDQLDATGYFNTEVQEFDFDFFEETAPAEFEQVSPDPRTYVT